jgi:hypothetical protein
MINRLQVTGYLSQRDNPGGYDADVVRAIRALQDDAATGPRSSPAHGTGHLARPVRHRRHRLLAELVPHRADGRGPPRAEVAPLSSGAVIGRNPRYQPDRLKVDTNIDMGAGFKRDQMREWAKTELATPTTRTGSGRSGSTPAP